MIWVGCFCLCEFGCVVIWVSDFRWFVDWCGGFCVWLRLLGGLRAWFLCWRLGCVWLCFAVILVDDVWVLRRFVGLWIVVVCGWLGGLAVAVWFAVFGLVWSCCVLAGCLGGLLILVCSCVIIQVFGLLCLVWFYTVCGCLY